MILYLDVISPKPKFIVIENNKIIECLYILEKNCNKISDILHKKFIELKSKYNLFDLLNCLIVCTGPGSYTSLRVGISFMIGLSYSHNKLIYGFDCTEFLKPSIASKDFYKTLILICSSNNQNFICKPTKIKDRKYQIYKVDSQYSLNNLKLNSYIKCISNFNLPVSLKEKFENNFKKIQYINFENNIQSIVPMIKNKKKLLKPIYISNNQILNR